VSVVGTQGAITGVGGRVLAIDDDPLFLEVVQVCLERSGCEVQTANDPREGLKQAIEGKSDLVFLDLMMPSMTGEEIMSLLKPLSRKQKVVVVSGCDEQEARSKSRDLGAAGYIQKPVDTRQFTGLLYDLIQDRIRDATVDDVPLPPSTILDRLVSFVFGECEPTPARQFGAVAGLLAAG